YVAALGAAIGLAIDKCMQIGLVAGIDHEKARRGLAEVATYDPFMQESFIPPISVADYEVLDVEPQAEAFHSPKVVFEKEVLDTTPNHSPA
nr:hypothetical protein [Tanacetum cinerariifolium]